MSGPRELLSESESNGAWYSKRWAGILKLENAEMIADDHHFKSFVTEPS